MARLIWSPRAIRDLRGICEYIARSSEQNARMIAEQVITRVESIPDHPYLGTVVAEYGRENLREHYLHSYRILYRIRDELIEIVSIWRGARLLPEYPPH